MKNRYALCPVNKTMMVEDDFMEEGTNYVEVFIRKCSYNCRPDAQELLSSNKFVIIFGYIESSFDFYNSSHPFKFNYNTNRWFHIFEPRTFKRKLFLSEQRIETDIGVITNLIKEAHAIKIVAELNEDNDRDDERQPYVHLKLYASKQVSNIERSYDKVIDILSDLGGLASITMLVFSLFISWYNRIALRLHVLNSTILKPYIMRTGRPFNFYYAMKFHVYVFLNKFGAACCFSKKTQIKSKLFFNGIRRIESCLDIKTFVSNSRDIMIFRQILINESQERVLEELETKGLLTKKEYITCSAKKDFKRIRHRVKRAKETIKKKAILMKRGKELSKFFKDEHKGGESMSPKKGNIFKNERPEDNRSLGLTSIQLSVYDKMNDEEFSDYENLLKEEDVNIGFMEGVRHIEELKEEDCKDEFDVKMMNFLKMKLELIKNIKYENERVLYKDDV